MRGRNQSREWEGRSEIQFRVHKKRWALLRGESSVPLRHGYISQQEVERQRSIWDWLCSLWYGGGFLGSLLHDKISDTPLDVLFLNTDHLLCSWWCQMSFQRIFSIPSSISKVISIINLLSTHSTVNMETMNVYTYYKV